MAKRGRKKGTKKFVVQGKEVYLSPKMQAELGFAKKRGRPPKVRNLPLYSAIPEDVAPTERFMPTLVSPMIYQAEHIPTIRGLGVGVKRRGRPKGSKNKPKSVDLQKMSKTELIKMLTRK